MSLGRTLLALCAALPLATDVQAFPQGDWGDAPSGWTAYWDNGNGGRFPTCFGGGYGYIWHGRPPGGIAGNCYLGTDVDQEIDGNGGVCWEPYDGDECWWMLDGDAGLFLPTPFTYGPSRQPITCSGQPPTSLGQACAMARWGRDIEIYVANNMGPGVPAYLNVLFDWDRSGDWSAYPVGPYGCGIQVSEHVVRNQPVPPGFNGAASQLGLADFQVGPDSGLVWVRFTISNQPVLTGWIGGGFFDLGETEDYMLHVAKDPAELELGDAPNGVVAYPGGTIGHFPTCAISPGKVEHDLSGQLFLGPAVDAEMEGNQNDCAFNDYDHDECFDDGDAGLTIPRPFTLDAFGSVAPCDVSGTPLGTVCQPIVLGTNLDLQVSNLAGNGAYLNFLMDWDHDGRWQNNPGTICPGGASIDEHVLANVYVPPGFTGLLSSLAQTVPLAGSAGYAWARFTLSDVPAPFDWNGGGDMGVGETEDYLLLVNGVPGTGVEDATDAARVGDPWPNPARGAVRLDYALPRAARVSATVVDVTGRKIRELDAGVREAGSHRLEWDGATLRGFAAPTGVYFVHVRVDGATHVRRVMLLH